MKLRSLLIFAPFLFASCGIHSAMLTNVNSNITNVELSRNNFKVVEKVSGNSTATYFMGIGGLTNKALVENAKAKMVENVQFDGSSRALINLVTETH
jgi:hypothetical protein